MISTLMQPIVNQNDLFVDNNEQPLVHGRLDFLDPVSNNLINVYSYTNDEYTILTNPVILDIYGRAEQSVFSDSLTYCRLYAYRGLDEHNQPIYEFVREWYAGHNAQSAISDTVYGIEALRNLDPEYNKNVMVVGYYNEHDCGPRRYYWDENSTLDIDNIYIVGSKNTSVGRWILNFDGEYLPSTYAGVYPGKTANINALLSYVEVINGKKTAPGVWFVPGEYSDSTVALITNKKLLIDNSSSFSYESITSNDDIKIVGGGTDHYITDLYGVKIARSSWYRTLQGFLDSGAKELVFEKKTNFAQAPVMTKNTELRNVHLVNKTDTYAGWLGFGNYKITLDSCTVDEHLFYPSTSRLYFQNMLVTDRYFYRPNVNNMDISRINADNIHLCNFDNAEIYLKWMYQKGYTDIDMEGRLVSDINFAPSLTGLRNCLFNTLTLNDSEKSVFLENCQGIIRSVNVKSLAVNKCRLTIDVDVTLNGGILDIVDSELSGSGTISAGNSFALNIERSKVTQNITFPYITNPATQYYDIIIDNSNITGVIEVKKLTMTNSKAGTVKIYGASGSISLVGNVKLENNVIDDFGFFTVTGFEQYISNCTFVQTRIVNNTFNNSFTCPFYVTDSAGNKFEFISRTGNHDYLYKGNNGQCPIESTQLITTLPYTDGAYKDADEHEWGLELGNRVRLFLPGELFIAGTLLGAKMVNLWVDDFSHAVSAIPRINFGLFRSGSFSLQNNDYFQMCLASDIKPKDNTSVITLIKL